jgi:hypothetical protein
MGFLFVLIAGLLGWAVWQRKLTTQQLLPIMLGLAGGFVALRGNFIVGGVAIAVAAAWYRGMNWRLTKAKPDQTDQVAIDKARFMLGVSRFDNAEYIKERHRALITKNHPDTGGSNERARDLNEARDLLLRELDTKIR